MPRIRWTFCSLVLALGLPAPIAAADAKPLEFRVKFSKAVASEPFTGRVYVMLSKQSSKELPQGPNWIQPEPFFAVDVKDWKPEDNIVIDATALGFPMPLAKLPRGPYFIQAVMDFDRGERSFSAAQGNGYSKPIQLQLDPANSGAISLTIDQIYQPMRPGELDGVKLVAIKSRLLSEFHGRPVRLKAGIVLPKSFTANPQKCYPVIYEIPGFGGGIGIWSRYDLMRKALEAAGVEVLFVALDANCRWGHHVFADSKNNGPCGQALIEEMIPHIEKEFRAIGRPEARFLTGHSSGGWSSLWLQTRYPEFFGGVWATSPDPVDFRDFQRVNIYQEGANIFTDEAGGRRPLARFQGRVAFYYKPFSDMEVVMGHGGQLQSFEAVFGPRGPDGKPKPLWDRSTGKIDPQVARTWEDYDIRLRLERNWQTLAPQLAGKLHVYMGADDNFYLDGATRLLKESLAKLGSDAQVEIFAGKDHGTLLDAAMQRRIGTEMAQAWKGKTTSH